MLLRALADFAETQGLMADPDYEPKPVTWLVTVDAKGRFAGMIGTHDSAAKGKPRAKTFSIPRQSGRTAADVAEFLVDKAEYVFGFGERDREKLEKRRKLFLASVREAAAATGDKALKAVERFLASAAERGKAIRQFAKTDSGFKSNDLFTFIHKPDVDVPVMARPAVRAYWKGLRAQSQVEDPTAQCLVSGEACVPADKHPSVRGLPGASTSGAALVSFNSPAFESYGLSRNDNAPISRRAAEACSSALNRLVSRAYVDPVSGNSLPRLNVGLTSDTVAVFWSAGGSALTDKLSYMFSDPDPEQVERLLLSPLKGRRHREVDDSPFYAAVLSGAQGRAVLRSWFRTALSEVRRNLALYFDDLDVVNPFDDGRFLPALWRLLRSTAVAGDEKNVVPGLAEKLFMAALRGTPFPRGLLEAAVRRARMQGPSDSKGFPRERVALIKACLARELRRPGSSLRRLAPGLKEVTREMDRENTVPAYRLGRLFAALERLQASAIGNPNASVADRYYGAASTRPATVFPTLMRLSQHHASKSDYGGFYRGVMDEILEPLREFPKTLAVEEQGLFALGYHHQRADFFKKKTGGDDAGTPRADA